MRGLARLDARAEVHRGRHCSLVVQCTEGVIHDGLYISIVLRIRPDGNAFELEVDVAERHDDGLEVGVLGDQLDGGARAAEALDGDVVAEARDDDLAVLRFARFLHREQVAVEDAGVAHAHAAHLQQVVGPAGEHAGFDQVGLVDVLLREDGAAGRDAAHQRQRQLRQAGQRQRELLAARLVERAQGVGLRRMPRDVPPTSSITPLRASACRCSSAALGERKPSSAAISARVGGAPVRSMALCTRSRICCWRSVSLGLSSTACP